MTAPSIIGPALTGLLLILMAYAVGKARRWW